MSLLKMLKPNLNKRAEESKQSNKQKHTLNLGWGLAENMEFC